MEIKFMCGSMFVTTFGRRLFVLVSSYGRSYQWRWASGHCLLFPGQGSQYVGMGTELISAADTGALPEVASLFRVAEEVFGHDLRPQFLHGPQDKLDETIHCQPAVVVASLAGVEKFKHQRSQVGGAGGRRLEGSPAGTWCVEPKLSGGWGILCNQSYKHLCNNYYSKVWSAKLLLASVLGR